MFLCRVRKSLKGQVFCVRYSRSRLVRIHKHNLCTVARRLRKRVCVSRSVDPWRAKKPLLLADEHEQ